jgi:hypothetical protein
MDKKLFSFDIDESNNEQGYTHTEYVWAENIDNATDLAREYANGYYTNGQQDGEDCWTLEYNFCNIFWSLTNVQEVSKINIYPINSGRFSLDVSAGKPDPVL